MATWVNEFGIAFSVDEQGHEHKGKGEGGGQFTSNNKRDDTKEIVDRIGSDGLALIRKLREEVREVYTTNLGVCKEMSTQLEVELGIKGVIGRRRNKEHHWNVFNDGTIIDTTADQYGDAPIILVKPTDDMFEEYRASRSYKALSIDQKHLNMNDTSWAIHVLGECLLESNGDVQAALSAAGYILATQPVPTEFALSTDATGHEHDAKTGQFVSSGTFFHGSDEDIPKFDPVATGGTISFTDNPHHASEFGNNVHRVELDVRNPIDLRHLGSGADEGDERVSAEAIESALAEHNIHVKLGKGKGFTTALLNRARSEIVRQAKKLGYDAIKVMDYKEFEAEETQVFHPHQIRHLGIDTNLSLSTDATGHEHKGKGEGGGRFIGKGEGASNLRVTEEVRNRHHGQTDSTLKAFTLDGKEAAYLDYAVTDDRRPLIEMVESKQKGLRAGAHLVEELAKQYGYENIDWGMMTPDGVNLRDSLDKKHGIERTIEITDVDAFVEGAGGKILSKDDGPEPGVKRVYVEFGSVEEGRRFAEQARRMGSERVDVQEWEEKDKSWVECDITERKGIVRTKPSDTNVSLSVFLAHDIHNRAAQGILNRTLKYAKGMTVDARRALDSALKKQGEDGGTALLQFVNDYRVQLARLLTTTQLAAVLEGMREVAVGIPTVATFPGAVPIPPTLEPNEAAALIERLESLSVEERAQEMYELSGPEQLYVYQTLAAKEASPLTATGGDSVEPPFALVEPDEDDPEAVHFPTIDEAVRHLAAKNVLTRDKFDALNAAARAKAFTVAGIDAEEMLTRLRDSLAKNVEQGADYKTWVKQVLDDVDEGTFLSDAHLETVFRANVQAALSDGQMAVLQHPLIRSGFPYSAYDAIHDDRARENHLALETYGIQGTNIYRTDDSVLQLFRPPWSWNCRCGWTPMTVRQAAEAGIHEAEQWLESGVEPYPPAYVKMPPFQPPDGFRRAITAAPLSVRLSLQSLSVSTDNAEVEDNQKRARSIAEILAAIYGDAVLDLIEQLEGMSGTALSSARPERTWDTIAHPRDKRGKFIKKNSPEAVAAAHEKVKVALKSPKTPQSLQELTEHLSILTVKQLHELKKSHNLKASGKTVAELQGKIADRLHRGQRDPHPWEGGQLEHGKVYNAPVDQLHVDPSRFQFKLNVSKDSGVTDELRQVQNWNPDFAGVVSVWKDPADNQTYVVNGHHRHELASRLGVQDMAVRYVQAGSAKEARAVGALINIAEGRGTAVDAAKFMRDTGTAVEDMEKHGISLKGKLAQDAVTLTHLNDRLFDRLARGVLDQQKATAVAKHLQDHALQDQLFRVLDKREDEGKDLSPKVIEEMAKEMATTPTITRKDEGGLFGDWESEESLFIERNELKSHVRDQLARDVADFTAVASKRRAEKVASAGNVLDPEENKRIATEANRGLNLYDLKINSKGPLSDALNQAAAQLAGAKTKGERNAVKQRAAETVRDLIEREQQAIAGGKGSGDPGGIPAPGTEHPAAEPIAPDTRGRDAATAGVTQPAITPEHLAKAQLDLASGRLFVKGNATSPVLLSDLSGELIRRHVVLAGGQRIHPDELQRAQVNDGKVELHPHENLTVRDPLQGGQAQSSTFGRALAVVASFSGHDEDRVTLTSSHGYSATKTRGEWRKLAQALGSQVGSMSTWYDRDNPPSISTAAAQSEQSSTKEMSAKETEDFFNQPVKGRQTGLFDWKPVSERGAAAAAGSAAEATMSPAENVAATQAAAVQDQPNKVRGVQDILKDQRRLERKLGGMSPEDPRAEKLRDQIAAFELERRSLPRRQHRLTDSHPPPSPAKYNPAKSYAINGKEPWEMTAQEWEQEFDRYAPATWAGVGREPMQKSQGGEVLRRLAHEGRLKMDLPDVTDPDGILQPRGARHREVIAAALAAGKDVPAKVVAEYPDLKIEEKKPLPREAEAQKQYDLERHGKEPWEMTKEELRNSVVLPKYLDKARKVYPHDEKAAEQLARHGMMVAAQDHAERVKEDFFASAAVLDIEKKLEDNDRQYQTLIGKMEKLTHDEIPDDHPVVQAMNRMVVAATLAAGQPVPAEVQADYPDLAAKYGTRQASKQVSPTPAAQPQAQSATQVPATHAALAQALTDLEGKDNYIPLAALRQHPALAKLSRVEQDGAIDALRRSGAVTLSSHEGRHGISDADRAAGIEEEGSLLGYASIKDRDALAAAQVSAATLAPEKSANPPTSPLPSANQGDSIASGSQRGADAEKPGEGKTMEGMSDEELDSLVAEEDGKVAGGWERTEADLQRSNKLLEEQAKRWRTQRESAKSAGKQQRGALLQKRLQEQQLLEKTGKLPDGRLIPKVGDAVSMTTSGGLGQAVVVEGIVERNRDGLLKVRVTHDSQGGSHGNKGRVGDWSADWTVKGDPARKVIQQQQQQTEEDAARQRKLPQIQHHVKVEQSRQAAVDAGEIAVDVAIVKPGDVLTDHHSGKPKKLIVKEVVDGIIFAENEEGQEVNIGNGTGAYTRP